MRALLVPEMIYAVSVFAALGLLTFVSAPGEDLAEPTSLDGDGTVCTLVAGELVPADPKALAAGMGMDPQIYALARAIASEATSNRLVQTAVGWTIENYRRAHGRTLLRLITDVSGDGTGDGYFGRQAQGRYVASSRDTTPDIRELAQQIADGDIEDPTGGAEHFDSPQSYGVQAGTSSNGADRFAANREAEGFELVVLLGVSATVIRFWRPA